ncbi:uncharacterized protein [Halyomorpha halys]|uniref:uncharacterized protein n=1 Tax=Halyomorpha halys TaxID=286706 RepID=UPI0034D21849
MAAIMKKRGRVIALQWIPGHVGINGNEHADMLAKLGCGENQLVLPLSYRTVKSMISSYCKDRTSTIPKVQAEGKKWESLLRKDKRIPGNLNRAERVACFRLVTGHDLLQKHLHRIGIVDSPKFLLCNMGEMDGGHLLTCIGLEDIQQNTDQLRGRVKLYWTARGKMA